MRNPTVPMFTSFGRGREVNQGKRGRDIEYRVHYNILPRRKMCGGGHEGLSSSSTLVELADMPTNDPALDTGEDAVHGHAHDPSNFPASASMTPERKEEGGGRTLSGEGGFEPVGDTRGLGKTSLPKGR